MDFFLPSSSAGVLVFSSICLGLISTFIQFYIARFLAYSGIVQVAFLIVAMLAAISHYLWGIISFYFGVYTLHLAICLYALHTLSKSVSFTRVVKFISDLLGAHKKAVLVTLAIVVSLLTFAGVPPFLGFFSKFTLLFQLFLVNDFLYISFFLLGILVVSNYYYLQVLKALFYSVQRYSAMAAMVGGRLFSYTPILALVFVLLAAVS